MKIDFFLNSYLWVCPNLILELQHAFLPSKCCELRSVLWLFISHYFTLKLTFGFFKEIEGMLVNQKTFEQFEIHVLRK
jgi:hypothetical protein